MNFKKSVFCAYLSDVVHIFENILRKVKVVMANSFGDMNVFVRIF